jgi:hypothetical protein
MDDGPATDNNAKRHGWSPLSDHAHVIRAPLFSASSDDPRRIFRIVSIKDFPRGGYLPEPTRLTHLSPHDRRAEKYIVHPYDVLITMVGTIGEVTVAPPDCPDNWVPATNIFVVRFMEPTARVAQTFYGLMKSRFGAELLHDLAHGSRIQIVSKKQFSRTPIPPFTEQLIAIFENLWNQEVDLYSRGYELLERAGHLYDTVPNVQEIVA